MYILRIIRYTKGVPSYHDGGMEATFCGRLSCRMSEANSSSIFSACTGTINEEPGPTPTQTLLKVTSLEQAGAAHCVGAELVLLKENPGAFDCGDKLDVEVDPPAGLKYASFVCTVRLLLLSKIFF